MLYQMLSLRLLFLYLRLVCQPMLAAELNVLAMVVDAVVGDQCNVLSAQKWTHRKFGNINLDPKK